MYLMLNDWWENASLRTDVIENDNGYVIEVEVPGIKSDQISVELDDDILIIKARRDKTEKKLLRSERSTSKLERRFIVPRNTDKNEIKAKLEDGILRVELKVKEEQKLKRIEVLS